jgi:hypothetical protein
MPLHFGKIGAAIALLTVGAFIAWLLFTTLFATEQAEQKIDKQGAAEFSLDAGLAAYAGAERNATSLPIR